MRSLSSSSKADGPPAKGKIRSVIIGPPGAGKGTISQRVIRDFKLVHLSSGDLLRTHMSEQTGIGQEAQRYLEQGKLVPDMTMLQLILNELKLVADQGWLLDGFPRTLAQVEALVQKASIHVVLNLEVPFKTIIERVKGRWVHVPSGRVYNDEYNPPRFPKKDDVTGEQLVQRADDHPEAVHERLKQYEKQTKPVIDFFEEKGLVKTFTGTESDVIWPQIKTFIEEELITDDDDD